MTALSSLTLSLLTLSFFICVTRVSFENNNWSGCDWRPLTNDKLPEAEDMSSILVCMLPCAGRWDANRRQKANRKGTQDTLLLCVWRWKWGSVPEGSFIAPMFTKRALICKINLRGWIQTVWEPFNSVSSSLSFVAPAFSRESREIKRSVQRRWMGSLTKVGGGGERATSCWTKHKHEIKKSRIRKRQSAKVKGDPRMTCNWCVRLMGSWLVRTKGNAEHGEGYCIDTRFSNLRPASCLTSHCFSTFPRSGSDVKATTAHARVLPVLAAKP